MSDGPVSKSGDREALFDLADDLGNCKITLTLKNLRGIKMTPLRVLE